MRNTTLRAWVVALAGVLGLVCTSVIAQGSANFPNKPIRFISPSGTGLVNDTWTRLIAQRLTDRLGWATVVENRPGGNYIIGTQAMLNAPADGHVLLAAVSSQPVVQHTMKDVPFDLRRDIIALTRVINVQLVLVANVNQPFKTLPELVAYAKANPNKLSYGALNLGSLTHLAGELFKQVAGIEMVNVPYKGEAMMIDTIAGVVQLSVSTTSSAAANIKAGRLRALAVLSPTRSPILPDVPTVAETGLPPVDADGWQGLIIKAGTPQPIVDRLHREITAILQTTEFQDKLKAQGALPVSETPEQFRRKIDADLNTWGKLLATGKIKF